MRRLAAAAILLATWSWPARAFAQQTTAPSASDAWTWAADARVIVGFNYQQRKFADIDAWESQNWFMGTGERPVGAGRLTVTGMFSAEPFTVRGYGSPQVFQTGETLDGYPNIDYQHPHELLMNLGASYRRPLGRLTFTAGAYLVGPPALGPEVFMHRASARDNPTTPLGHHQMDSTHTTPGVLRVGAEAGPLAVEGSWFQGREPDDNRTDLDLGALDSWALQARWSFQRLRAEVSGGRLHSPEWLEPIYDVTRLNASIGWSAEDGRLAASAAWGQNRKFHGIEDAYLLEAQWQTRAEGALYGRAELAVKEIIGVAALHPPGFQHPHPLSRVGAATLGYTHPVARPTRMELRVGGDVTAHHVAENLRDSYGARPVSFHLFVLIRPARSVHIH
jgi:hypothetical protein